MASHPAGNPINPPAAERGPLCYVDLILRPGNRTDNRPASVYKPWARHMLERRGYTLLASMGDQFSDLEGEHVAPYSFKLPNPCYFIL